MNSLALSAKQNFREWSNVGHGRMLASIVFSIPLAAEELDPLFFEKESLLDFTQYLELRAGLIVSADCLPLMKDLQRFEPLCDAGVLCALGFVASCDHGLQCCDDFI